tara:strand:- start:2838 stop:3170 length:333 start_codon:yes stop_codon:yes gene_type:complete
MAVVKTWEINTCKRDISDGYITNVIYRLKATEDSVEIDGTRITGEVTFTKPESLPSDFIAFDTSKKTPDEATVLGWVKTALGDEVASMETAIDNAVTLVKTPVTATGVPW